MASGRAGWLLALAVWAGPMWGAGMRLGLLVEAPEGTPAEVLAAAGEEVRRTVRLPGVGLEWQALGPGPAGQSYGRVVVIRLKGECRAGGPGQEGERGPLGITHVADGAILPFVEADCGRVRRAAARVRRPPFRLGDGELGAALGRVIAHEIYHVLSGTSEHDGTGLAKESLTAAELFLGRIEFTEQALARMGEWMTAAPVRAALELEERARR